MLDPDEANIVPRAWEIGHGERLDPGFYDYPSLLFYLLAPVQAPTDAPSYLAARVAVAILGAAGVGAAWWLGRRAYGAPGAWAAAATTAVATTHVAYSRVAVTDVPLALGTTAALALALAGRLGWAGAAVGLAASAKYPGVLAAVPLVVAGWGRWRALALAGVAAAVAFAATSPFVLLNAGEARADVARVGGLARAGWLGFEHDPPTPLAFLDRLWDALPAVLIVAGAGVAVALARRTRADLVLLSFVAVYAAHLLPLNAHFDRYVLPLVPVLGAVAGRGRRLAVAAVVLCAVPLAVAIQERPRADLRETRLVAREHVLRTVPPRAAIAVEPSLPELPPSFRVVRLALPGPGRPHDPRRDLDALRRAGVRYVLVSGAVADRVLAARDRYPRDAALYDDLRRQAELLRRVDPGGGRAGPWVELYRL